MSLAIMTEQGTDDAALREGAEWCVRRYAETAEPYSPGVPLAQHISLQLQTAGRKSFFFEVDKATRVGLYGQHTAEEFDLKVFSASDSTEVSAECERIWVAQHEHDDEVGSFAIEHDGDVNPDKLNAWLGKLLRENGIDIFRMKGFLSLAGEAERYVFQGVHMLFDAQPDRAWGDMPRRNQLVFIGRNLDEASIRSGFASCLI